MITDEMLANAMVELDRAILASLPEPDECHHAFSAEFEKKMQKLIRRTKHTVAYTFLQRAACIVVALLLAGSMFLVFNPTAHAAFANWLEGRFGEFYHFFYVGDKEPSGTLGTLPTAGSSSTDGSMPTDGSNPGDGSEGTVGVDVKKTYCLGWVPEGTVLLNTFETPGGTTSVYKTVDGKMLQFVYRDGVDAGSLFAGRGEYEDKFISDADLHGTIFISCDSSQTNAIIWTVEADGIICSISGYLEEADLVRMAKSLTIQKNH